MIGGEHGDFRTHLSGRLVVTTARGPWNLELMESYINNVKTLVRDNNLADAAWATVVIAGGEALTVPESEEMMTEFTRWRISNGLEYLVWSLEYSPLGRSIARGQWERIYSNAKSLEQHFFNDTQEALNWLADKGYHYELTEEDRKFLFRSELS